MHGGNLPRQRAGSRQNIAAIAFGTYPSDDPAGARIGQAQPHLQSAIANGVIAVTDARGAERQRRRLAGGDTGRRDWPRAQRAVHRLQSRTRNGVEFRRAGQLRVQNLLECAAHPVGGRFGAQILKPQHRQPLHSRHSRLARAGNLGEHNHQRKRESQSRHRLAGENARPTRLQIPRRQGGTDARVSGPKRTFVCQPAGVWTHYSPASTKEHAAPAPSAP